MANLVKKGNGPTVAETRPKRLERRRRKEESLKAEAAKLGISVYELQQRRWQDRQACVKRAAETYYRAPEPELSWRPRRSWD